MSSVFILNLYEGFIEKIVTIGSIDKSNYDLPINSFDNFNYKLKPPKFSPYLRYFYNVTRVRNAFLICTLRL